MAQDSFLSKLNVIALALVVLLAGVGLFVWLRWPSPPAHREPPANVKKSPEGWKIRYNANVSLAVRGSKKVRLDLLTEMLNEDQQLKNFAEERNGKTIVDETGAGRTILTTLKAVAEWHKKLNVPKAYSSRKKKLDKVYAAIDNLAENSPNMAVRREAKLTQEAIKRG